MTLAWFRDVPRDPATPADAHLAPIRAALARTHHLVDIDPDTAHTFPWRHARQPFDLCIYELTAGSEPFIAAYALHYPGLLLLRVPEPRDQRLLVANLVAVQDESLVARIADRYPEVRTCVLTAGVAEVRRDPERNQDAAHEVVFGTIPGDSLAAIERAMTRARDAGAAARLQVCHDAAELARCDAVLAAHWPPLGEPPSDALLAMAASQPVVVVETEITAAWPALDPQNWQPRHADGAAPIAVSVDPRDEEHSLLLAVRRLAADAPLRQQLGRAARTWVRAHASTMTAAAAWERAVIAATSLEPVACAAADGTERARAILDELGVRVDLW